MKSKRRILYWVAACLAIIVCLVWFNRSVIIFQLREEFLSMTHGGQGWVDGIFQLGRPQKPLPPDWVQLGAQPIHDIHVRHSWFCDVEVFMLETLFPEAYVEVNGG
ncbi:MAG TPA: hypothetical protein VGJ15_13130 [Pirellulales bacterium]|jgi:hypothetical protein